MLLVDDGSSIEFQTSILKKQLFKRDNVFYIRHEINRLNINEDILVLSSSEEVIKTKNRTPSSYSVVPNTAGILIADYIVKDIIKQGN